MLNSKTGKLAIGGIACTVLAAVFGLFGQWQAAWLTLSAGIVVVIGLILVLHRFIVRKLSGSPNGAEAAKQIRELTHELKAFELVYPMVNSSEIIAEQTKSGGPVSQTEATKSEGSESTEAPESPGAKKSEITETRPNYMPVGNFISAAVFRGGIGPKFEFAERVLKARGKLETFALRTKSFAIRDAFARAATNLHYDAAEIQKILRTMRAGKIPGVDVAKTWDPDLLLTLARILANQRTRQSDLEDAEVIFNAVWKLHGEKVLKKSDIYIFSEVLAELGIRDSHKKILRAGKIHRRDPVHYELVSANLVNPKRSTGGAQDWLRVINQLFTRENFSSIKIDFESGKSLLDSIEPSVTKKIDGPMVSVIVPTFKGSELIGTTLKCLQQQTWSNLEIIVVDDGSGPEHTSALERICSEYDNVQLVLQPENFGAYPARNRAMDIASGEFITVHDDDDWSHPEKIQTQVEHLIANPDEFANMTRHARVTPDLIFTRINNNPSVSQPNFSSLMLKKSLVEKLGRWDNVNRGADAEFRDRLVQATGQPVKTIGEVPLSFTRTHDASLTAGEIGRGYIDPSRLFYQRAYQEAHSEADSVEQLKNTQFAKPLNMLPGNRGKYFGCYDAVFVTDFAFPGGTSHLTLNEIEAASDAGLKVGLVHMFSPVNVGASGVTDRSLRVSERTNVDVLSLNDPVDVKHLVIRHPSVLQYADKLSSNFQPERVTIIINNPPVLTGGKGYGFDFDDVLENAQRLFGVKAGLIAESGVTRQLTAPLISSSLLSIDTWPGFIESVPTPGRFSNPHRRPVLGRHSRDATLKWPTYLDHYKRVYVSNDVYDVRIMGGITKVPGGAQKVLRKGAALIEFDGVPVPEFLDGLDFWAYFHSESLTESFGMSIVEAMAAGVVVILPKYMKPNFGDGAIYAEPRDVQQLVKDLWANPKAYREQSLRGIHVAESRYSKESFLNRLSSVQSEHE